MAKKRERDDPGDIDQKIRINELKEEAKELTGGQMTFTSFSECPPDIEEQFLRQVVEYERAPQTAIFKRIEDSGFALPNPAKMSDTEISAFLPKLIKHMGKLNIYLLHTDHLSDRELYVRLWSDLFHEEAGFICADGECCWNIDILGCYGDEETLLSFKYYADKKERRRWMKQFPDYKMPAHEDPPYDRDRHLPKSGF